MGDVAALRALPQKDTWQWAPPLADFIGDDEPPDDDTDDWIIRDIIPRSESWLLGGTWKGGKTWTALSLAIHVTLGRDWLGFQNCLGRPGRVLLLAFEDGPRRIAKRVWQMCRGIGTTPADPLLRKNLRISDQPLRLPDHVQSRAFVDEVTRWQPDMIAIDSLSRVMVGDQNSIGDATQFTTAWGELVRDTGASVGFLHHTIKGNSGRTMNTDPFNRIRGSGELLAAPRNLIVMDRVGDEASTTSLVSMRGNLELARDSFVLEYEREVTAEGRVSVKLHDRGGDGLKRAERRARRATDNDDKKATDELVVLKFARDRGAVSARALVESNGQSRSTWERAIGRLTESASPGLIASTPRGSYTITAAGNKRLEAGCL